MNEKQGLDVSSPGDDRIEDKQIDATTDWKEHEFQAPSLHASAIRLLREAGTMELAVQALETADRLLKDIENYRLEFAKRCGFDSYTETLAASETVGVEGNSPWYLTPLRNGHWLAWNRNSLHETRDFESKAGAEQFLRRRMGRWE